MTRRVKREGQKGVGDESRGGWEIRIEERRGKERIG